MVRTAPHREIDAQQTDDLRRHRHTVHGDRIRPHTAHVAIRLANHAIGEVRVMVSLFVVVLVALAILAVGR